MREATQSHSSVYAPNDYGFGWWIKDYRVENRSYRGYSAAGNGGWLFWLYLAKATLLIVYEIDSAYWKEWELLRLPGRIARFLWMHIPIVAIILLGLLKVDQQTPACLIFSLVLGLGGTSALAIHACFLRKGRPEFRTFASMSVLWSILLISVAQIVVTVPTCS